MKNVWAGISESLTDNSAIFKHIIILKLVILEYISIILIN